MSAFKTSRTILQRSGPAHDMGVNPEDARAYLQEALDAATVLGHRQDIAENLGRLGYAASLAGEKRRAEAYFNRSLDLVDELRFEAIRGKLLRYMAIHARAQDEFDQTAELFKQSLESDVRLNKHLHMIHTLVEIAEWACGWNAEHPLLPGLLGYLSTHPRVTRSLRQRISNLAASAAIEMEETESEGRSLERIVDQVREGLLSSPTDQGQSTIR